MAGAYVPMMLFIICHYLDSKLDGLVERVVPVAGLSCWDLQQALSATGQARPDASSANCVGE